MHAFERSLLDHAADLLPPGSRALVAVSGGADSVALAAGLAALADELELAGLTLAHLDHGLRPADAAEDLACVQELAATLGLELVHGRADVVAALDARGDGSVEAAARAVRYRWLAERARALGADRVAVAHTRDDQVETVLLRVVRGASLHGLAGMPAERGLAGSDARVVRPLLAVPREAGRAYLRARGLTWREDPSNADPRFLRNRLRHEVLPVLAEAANPQVDAALLRLSRQARDAADLLGVEARALLGDARCDDGWRIDLLQAAHPALRREALARIVAGDAPAKAATVHVDALERAVLAGHGAATLPHGRTLAIDPAGPFARLAPAREPVAVELALDPIDLPCEGSVRDPQLGLVFRTRRLTRGDAQCGDALHTDPARLALLDAAQVRGPLAIRRRRGGDRFWPLGAPGTRTLKRFLIDRKVPRDARDAVPVVTHADEPVWVVGHRIDERYKVTPATREVLEIQVLASGAE